MHITQVNNPAGSITFDYKTFKSDGTIKNETGKTVEGTSHFDLDDGKRIRDLSDLWLDNPDASTRCFTPKNGAEFYVLP